MFPTAHEFTEGKVKACHSILIELVHILGDFADDMAIVGGWVPKLLIPEAAERHIGSMDVDLALNGQKISEEAYATINTILTRHGYKQNESMDAQFRFFKDVTVNGTLYNVEVDLLTGEYGGKTAKNRRHEPIQDIKARKARGADLVFDRTETVIVTGDLPGNAGKDSVRCKIAGVVPFIVMKSMALNGRMKEKDAYDLDFVLRNYPGSVEAIGKLLAADLEQGLVREALSYIELKFGSVDHWGPKAVADFQEIGDEEERVRIQRRAFETAQHLLELTVRSQRG